MRSFVSVRAMILALTVPMLAPPQAFAQETRDARWLSLGNTARAEIFIDRESMRREGSRVIVWKRSEYFTRDPVNSGAAVGLDEIAYDCSARTSEIRSFVLQDERGNVIRSLTVPTHQREAQSISPGSVAESIFRQVCE